MGWEGWFRIQGWVGKNGSGYKDRLGRMVQNTRMGWEEWFRIQGWVGKNGSGYKDGLGRMVQNTRWVGKDELKLV